ncbi:MAG TPA: hypothetical protein OIM60_03580 [Clostridiaceae bacterium]|jgi:hypothetical protein|nr:hypothetical protein [Clostridiaceae bacterium]
MKRENIVTDVWNEYQKGVDYNYRQDLYNKTDKNFKFYLGNQWENAKLGGIQPITLNIIQSIVKYKVGVVKTNSYQIYFNSDTYENDTERKKLQDLCDSLNRFANRTWEKNQVDKIVRNCVDDACIDSEGIVYFYEDNDNIVPEQVDKTNIYYGNENDDNIQTQPYIIISFRRTVDEVKEEAKKNGMSDEELEKIIPDEEYHEQAGKDKRVDEISPMCLVLLKLYKKDGTIWAKKCTRLANVMNDSNLKIKLYPVAHYNWIRVKGSSRGQGEVEYLIPNQIEINKTATRRALAVKLGAFPKLVANTKYIKNTKALNSVGTTIELNELNADDVNKVVNYLKPAQMSTDAYNLQKELIDDTQNLAGAGDNVTGNIDPTQTSGKAILAVQQASQQPINSQVEAYKTFIEDIARIWFEMLKAYSVDGIKLTKEEKDYANDTTYDTQYILDYEELNKLELDLKIDITPKSAFDKYAMEVSLENLLSAGQITFEEYVNALPEDSTMPKSKLKEILKTREEKNKVITDIEKQGNALNGAIEQVMTQQEIQNQQQAGITPEEADMLNNQQLNNQVN